MIIYRESVNSYERTSKLKLYLTLLAMTVILFACIAAGFIILPYKIPFEALLVVLIAFLFIAITRKRIIAYYYSLIDQNVIFEKAYRGKEIILFDILLKDVIMFKGFDPEKKASLEIDSRNFHNFSSKNDFEKKYILVFVKSGERHMIVFTPSKQLIDCMKAELQNTKLLIK